MYQVKIFNHGYLSDLEENINKFLTSMNNIEGFKLIDVKFNSYPYGEDNTDYHSAMIIYQR